jgi:FlaA1/EpsC-like NDP-sugar epimerase
VAVYDNFSYGKMDNVMAFIDDIDLYEADIMDQEALRAAMTEARPDVVFHMAALHFIPYCKEHPFETLRVNVEGTQRVLAEANEFEAAITQLGYRQPDAAGGAAGRLVHVQQRDRSR